MKRKFSIFIFLSIFFLFACGQKEKVEEVSYRLKWLYNVSAVGDLYADVYGYFAQNGL